VLIGSSAVYDGAGGDRLCAGKAGLEGIMKYVARNHTRQGVRAM